MHIRFLWRLWWFWTGLSLIAMAAPADRLPTAGAAEPWLTGTTLHKRLSQEIGPGSWSGIPLRDALTEVSRKHRVAVLLDRRVDPGQPLKMSHGSISLRELLARIADARGLHVSMLGSVACFGPPEFTTRMRTLAELRRQDVSKLPAPLRDSLAARKSMRWDDFTTPAELLGRIAEEGGFTLAGLDRVPHDLWAGAELPPISPIDRLTWIAGQFDLTFAVDPQSNTVSLTPIPPDVSMVRSYPGGSKPEEKAQQVAALLPDCEVKLSGGKVWVKGRLEDHERLAAASRPTTRPVRPRPGTEIRIAEYNVKNHHLGDVLENLAKQLQVELTIDRAAFAQAGISLDQLVTVTVKDASIEELFRAVAKEGGAIVRRRGAGFEVVPAP